MGTTNSRKKNGEEEDPRVPCKACADKECSACDWARAPAECGADYARDKLRVSAEGGAVACDEQACCEAGHAVWAAWEARACEAGCRLGGGEGVGAGEDGEHGDGERCGRGAE